VVTRTLLIDADIVAYRSSAGSETKYDWGDTGGAVKATDLDAAKKSAEDEISSLISQLDADEVIICLSDDFQNFREDVWKGYKQNRVSTERPEHLYDIKEWFSEEYETAMRPRMEADDVMGILSTEPHEGERIIVSQDKDMQTIPGLLFNPGKDKKVRDIRPEFAERFMLWQALTGDATDGYKGCPDIGPSKADPILDSFYAFFSVQERRGGPWKLRFEVDEEGDLTDWQRILTAYAKAGLGEPEAIQQVNLARILKHSDLDGNRIIPWVPSMLQHHSN